MVTERGSSARVLPPPERLQRSIRGDGCSDVRSGCGCEAQVDQPGRRPRSAPRCCGRAGKQRTAHVALQFAQARVAPQPSCHDPGMLREVVRVLQPGHRQRQLQGGRSATMAPIDAHLNFCSVEFTRSTSRRASATSELKPTRLILRRSEGRDRRTGLTCDGCPRLRRTAAPARSCSQSARPEERPRPRQTRWPLCARASDPVRRWSRSRTRARHVRHFAHARAHSERLRNGPGPLGWDVDAREAASGR